MGWLVQELITQVVVDLFFFSFVVFSRSIVTVGWIVSGFVGVIFGQELIGGGVSSFCMQFESQGNSISGGVGSFWSMKFESQVNLIVLLIYCSLFKSFVKSFCCC